MREGVALRGCCEGLGYSRLLKRLEPLSTLTRKISVRWRCSLRLSNSGFKVPGAKWGLESSQAARSRGNHTRILQSGQEHRGNYRMRGLEAAGHARAFDGYNRDGTSNCFSHPRRGHRQQRRLRAGHEAARTVLKCTALRSFWSQDFGGTCSRSPRIF